MAILTGNVKSVRVVDGNLFDFLCLWYGVSAHELWRRLRAEGVF